MKDFKVRCIKSSSYHFRLGEVYEVKNGILKSRDGTPYPTCYKSCEQINGELGSQFELVEEEKMFGKSDLKTGMVVETKRWGKFIVVLGTKFGDYLINNTEQQPLKDYNANLKCGDADGCQIIRVYEPQKDAHMRFGRWDEMNLIWERKESPIEITIEEIAKLKGVSADRIRIKDRP